MNEHLENKEDFEKIKETFEKFVNVFIPKTITITDYSKHVWRCIQVAKDMDLKSWIVNAYEFEKMIYDDDKWIRNNWVPMFLESGVKNLAVVLPNKVSGRIFLESTLSMIEEKIKVKYCSEYSEAVRWIDNAENH